MTDCVIIKFLDVYISLAEQEQDEAMERLKKERELRRKKQEEDSLTLEQTKEQVGLHLLYFINPPGPWFLACLFYSVFIETTARIH